MKLGPETQEVLESVCERLVRYWRSSGRANVAEDLAQDGILRCLVKHHLWEDKQGQHLQRYLFKTGVREGVNYIRLNYALRVHLRRAEPRGTIWGPPKTWGK